MGNSIRAESCAVWCTDNHFECIDRREFYHMDDQCEQVVHRTSLREHSHSLSVSTSLSHTHTMYGLRAVSASPIAYSFFLRFRRSCVSIYKKDVYWTRSLANCCAISIRHSGHKRAFKIIFKGWESVFLQGFLILLHRCLLHWCTGTALHVNNANVDIQCAHTHWRMCNVGGTQIEPYERVQQHETENRENGACFNCYKHEP